uniref:BPTI/Kunitz inhibitor domain-containing protein n=1 Tax=Elaeophora elaphi TaxID=1147741 RepID=A0A0R3S299_9BILA
MLLLSIAITMIKICLANNEEIPECMWITCVSPKVCQHINGIITCVLPDDAMKTKMEVSSESVSLTSQMNLITESILTEPMTAHFTLFPDLPIVLSSLPEVESFPSFAVTEKMSLLDDRVINVDPEISEENFTVKTLPEICLLPAVTGSCSKMKILWYYNFTTGRCQRFSFSGCGNANHFYTRKDCEETCLVEYPNKS